MKWYQFWMVFVFSLTVNACSPSIDAMATPPVVTEIPTLVPSPVTPTATDIPLATCTPAPTQTSPSTPTSTPLPPTSTPIPTPDIQFSADRSYIKVGMCVVFTWEVGNSKTVYFYAEGEPWEDRMVSSSGNREECRQESTMYYLRVVGLNDTVEIREIHVPVEPMPGL